MELRDFFTPGFCMALKSESPKFFIPIRECVLCRQEFGFYWYPASKQLFLDTSCGCAKSQTTESNFNYLFSFIRATSDPLESEIIIKMIVAITEVHSKTDNEID